MTELIARRCLVSVVCIGIMSAVSWSSLAQQSGDLTKAPDLKAQRAEEAKKKNEAAAAARRESAFAAIEKNMVALPAGSFLMGSPSGEAGRLDNEGPQRRVIFAAFAIGKYEVTFAEWDACVADGGCNGYRPDDMGWGRGTRPVINISHEDAKAYAAWVSRKTGKRYRLLTEAEWEYAARAGTTTAYPWGNRASHDNANYGTDECCAELASGRDQWVHTAPVGQFPANAFGLHDMYGNVWEWVEDCYADSYSGAPTDGRAVTTGHCSYRVVRGGSWAITPQMLRSAIRFKYSPSVRNINMGFRLARTHL